MQSAWGKAVPRSGLRRSGSQARQEIKQTTAYRAGNIGGIRRFNIDLAQRLYFGIEEDAMPEAPSDIDYTVDVGRHETMFRANTPKGEEFLGGIDLTMSNEEAHTFIQDARAAGLTVRSFLTRSCTSLSVVRPQHFLSATGFFAYSGFVSRLRTSKRRLRLASFARR
jgi:hypothetical protein